MDAARKAGFTGTALAQAVAIAWAESHGNGGQSTYVDPTTGQREQSYGVTQINVPSHPGYDAHKLATDPVYAFKAMYDISGGGQNFSQWTTYSGATPAGKAANAFQYMPQTYKLAGLDPATAPTNPTPGGSVTTGPTVAHPTAASTPEEIEAYIRANYSDVAPFLANPEIRKIAFDAATSDNPPSYEELSHRIQQTDYWHTHSATSRNFDLLLADDPTAAVQLIDRAKVTVGGQLQQYGVNVNDDQLGSIAKQAIRNGWIGADGKIADQQSLTNFTMFALGNQNGGTGNFAPGTKPAVDVAALRAITKSYFVPMTDQQLAQAAGDIEAGKQTKDGFTQMVANQAKSLFQNDPDIQSAIDKGSTPETYFAPIVSTVAQTLNVTPESIDLMSPKYQTLMQMYDPATKSRRAMTLGEATQWARNQPGFKETPTYKQQDAQFGLNLANMFGAT